MILTGYVVGNKIYDNLQTATVSALHQILKLSHTLRYVLGEIRIDIIVVLDGIGRSGFTFHNGRMVGLDIVTAVVSLRSMLDDARVPYMCSAKLLDFSQRLGCKVSHLAASIFGDAAIIDAVVIVVSE